jgi:hypothetical protein
VIDNEDSCKTPADLVGIEVQGENKWLTLIQNATREPTKFDNGKERRGQDEPTTT